MSARLVGLLLWLGMGGVTIAAVLWQLQHPPQLPVVMGAAARPPELPTVTPLELFRLPPPELYGEVADRPLFIAARRPEPPPPAETPPEKPVLPGLEKKFLLLGIMITPSSTVALLRPEGANARTAWVKPGETINEWQLETVFPNRVVLRQGQATQELPLAHPHKPPKPRPNPAGVRPAQGTAPSVRIPNIPPQGGGAHGAVPPTGASNVPQPGALPPSIVPVPPQDDGTD